MTKLKEQYRTVIAPKLQEALGRKNVFETPKILKVTINTGLSNKRDPKFIETMVDTLTQISGQKPVVTKARLSIAGFKIREGQALGAMVTLRGNRMWHFLEKLVNITFPRIRDFRGIPTSAVDRDGNFNYGFKEHIAFPEIQADAIESIHGLQVSITTTAANHEEGLQLFRALGFPFKQEETK